MSARYFVQMSWRPEVALYWEVTLPDTPQGRASLADHFEHAKFGQLIEYTDTDDERRDLAQLVVDYDGDWPVGDATPKARELGINYYDGDDGTSLETIDGLPDFPLIPLEAWSNVQKVLYGSDPLMNLHHSLHAYPRHEYVSDGEGI